MAFSVQRMLGDRFVVESNTSAGIGFMEAVDDIFEEAEVAGDYLSFIHLASDEEARSTSDTSSRDFSHVRKSAAQSVASSTARAYHCLALQFASFCHKKGWCPVEIQPWHLNAFDSETDYMIIAWIMESCDYHDMNNNPRHKDSTPCTASHASKMRCAVNMIYAHEGRRGNQAWNAVNCSGNPALSFPLSSYLRGLRRRKVQIYGEKPQSARAVTVDIMKKLYRLNTQFMQQPDMDDWATCDIRIMMQAIMTLAFVCFLRIDEVLTLQMHEVEFVYDDERQNWYIVVTLHHRKTEQEGKIKPFRIYLLPTDKAHICPVRWLSKWLATSAIKRGFLFPKVTANLDIIQDKVEEHLPASEFILFFRCLLMDIEIVDIFAYAGHSFRRGGVQYCSSYLRWTLREICVWGGWSINFTPGTVFKYLVSWNDDDSDTRTTFFDVDRSLPDFCRFCGRGTPPS